MKVSKSIFVFLFVSLSLAKVEPTLAGPGPTAEESKVNQNPATSSTFSNLTSEQIAQLSSITPPTTPRAGNASAQDSLNQISAVSAAAQKNLQGAVSCSSSSTEEKPEDLLSQEVVHDISTISNYIMKICPPGECVAIVLGRSPTPFLPPVKNAWNVPMSNFRYGIKVNDEDSPVPPLKKAEVKKLYAHFDRYLPQPSEIGNKRLLLIDYTDSGASLLAGHRYIKDYYRSNLDKEGKYRPIDLLAITLDRFDPGLSNANFLLPEIPDHQVVVVKEDSSLGKLLLHQKFDRFAPLGTFDIKKDELATGPSSETSPLYKKFSTVLQNSLHSQTGNANLKNNISFGLSPERSLMRKAKFLKRFSKAEQLAIADEAIKSNYASVIQDLSPQILSDDQDDHLKWTYEEKLRFLKGSFLLLFSQVSSSSRMSQYEQLQSSMDIVIDLLHTQNKLETLDSSESDLGRKLEQAMDLPGIAVWKEAWRQLDQMPSHVKHFTLEEFRAWLRSETETTKNHPSLESK